MLKTKVLRAALVLGAYCMGCWCGRWLHPLDANLLLTLVVGLGLGRWPRVGMVLLTSLALTTGLGWASLGWPLEGVWARSLGMVCMVVQAWFSTRVENPPELLPKRGVSPGWKVESLDSAWRRSLGGRGRP